MYTNFEDVQVGDKVKCHRGRGRDQIVEVYKVTAKTFCVEGFGRFWKHNGKGYGDADSWFGRWADKVEAGDAERIARTNRRVENQNLYSEHRVRDFSDSELEKVAAVIRLCNARRNAEAEEYAEKEAAAEAATQ